VVELLQGNFPAEWSKGKLSGGELSRWICLLGLNCRGGFVLNSRCKTENLNLFTISRYLLVLISDFKFYFLKFMVNKGKCSY
jgi:hypothetical protein